MKEYAIYLEHILKSIEGIECFVKGINKNEFIHNLEKQFAVTRGLEIIGEAVKHIPLSVRKKYPEVPWKDIVGTRDILIHAYFSTDLDLVWEITIRYLPKLKKEIIKILRD